MSTKIYMSAPDVGQAEEEAALRALRSGWVAPLGPEVDEFEQELSAYVGVEYAVALNSGTAGLHLGLLSLDVGDGDLVVTSTMTFAATANAITYTGARPVFVDSEIDTGNMSASILERTLSALAQEGKTPAAIVPVDLLGKAANYGAILEIADAHGVPVLADAAESLGAQHHGKAAGSFGRAAVVSFNGNKIMTTSGGGAVLTDDRSIAERVRYLSTQARQQAEHYEHTEVGFNYRLSNVLAAIGRAQLSRLGEMIARRRWIRDQYRAAIAGVAGLSVFGGIGDSGDNCWLTSILVESSETGWDPRALREHLASRDIESRPLWKPMHLQPVFAAERAFVDGSAEALFKSGLTLPSGSGMSDQDVARVIDAVLGFIDSAEH